MSKKIFVAMSGGVDSSVAAALLLKEGHEVAGVTMCFELPESAQDGASNGAPRCCGLEAIEDARRVCRKLGIQHHVLNYGDVLESLVIQDFMSEYALGRTPNPCVRCNQYLKFDRLFKDARALGGTHLATGHYAGIVYNEVAGTYEIHKAKDERKDQSYFLYGIPKEILSNIIFPLGSLTKDEVRAKAREFDLPVAQKKESQDICFIPTGKYHSFLKERGVEPKPGLILDTEGHVLGEHPGTCFYTIGQREGLAVSSAGRLYVVAIDLEQNEIVLGAREALLSRGLVAEKLNLFQDPLPEKALVKIRYGQKGTPASVRIDGDKLEVIFDTPQEAVTPGQSVVMYGDGVVLGGAIITSALK